jgi:type IV secretory pathway VirB2 component (pilin)
MQALNDLPVATIGYVIGCIVGGIVTILNPAALDFETYFGFVVGGSAVLGIGRGIAKREKR